MGTPSGQQSPYHKGCQCPSGQLVALSVSSCRGQCLGECPILSEAETFMISPITCLQPCSFADCLVGMPLGFIFIRTWRVQEGPPAPKWWIWAVNSGSLTAKFTVAQLYPGILLSNAFIDKAMNKAESTPVSSQAMQCRLLLNTGLAFISHMFLFAKTCSSSLILMMTVPDGVPSSVGM